MRQIIIALLLAIAGTAVAAPIPPSGSSVGAILNTASPQNAQMNIGTATIRGTLTATAINVTTFNVTNFTATNLIGSGAAITNLNASALASGTVPSARLAGSYTGITAVGTLSTGIWQGTPVGTQYGGTGQNWSTVNRGAIPFFVATGSMSTLAPAAANRILQTNGAGADPSWTATPTVLGTNITAIPLVNLSAGNLPSNIAINDASISTVSAVKVIGNISGNAANITGTLSLERLGAGQLAANIVAQSISTSGVTAGTYGGPSVFSQFTVGADGRVTSSTQGPVAISLSQISNGTLPSGLRVPAGNVDPGTLGFNVVASSLAINSVGTSQIVNQAVTSAKMTTTGISSGTYGSGLKLTQFTVGVDGRLSAASEFILAGISTATALIDVNNNWHGAAQTSQSSWTFKHASGILIDGPISAGSLAITGNSFSVGSSTFVVTGGRIGIGTTTLTERLNVLGNGLFTGSVAASTFTGYGGDLTGIASSAAFVSETNARIAADLVLSASTISIRSDLTSETAARAAADIVLSASTASLRTNLTSETAARIAADIVLSASTSSLRVDLSSETASRVAADIAISSSIACKAGAGTSSTLCQGSGNTAAGNFSSVAGGSLNAATGNFSAIGGGQSNTASLNNTTIAGGASNIASGDTSSIGGGTANMASGSLSTIGGGDSNSTAGSYAMIVGGRSNSASGDYSFAGGRQAKATMQGSFVWADSQGSDLITTATNQFLVRAQGGFLVDASSFTLQNGGLIINTGNISAGTTGFFITATDTITLRLDGSRFTELRQNNVTGSTGSYAMIMTVFGGSDTGGIGITGKAARGSPESPLAPLSGHTLLSLTGVPFDGSTFATISSVRINLLTEENISATAKGTRVSIDTTLPGTTIRTEKFTVRGSGNVGIGVVAPPYLLSVASGTLAMFAVQGTSVAFYAAAPIIQGRAFGGGNFNSPTAIGDAVTMLGLAGTGYDGTTYPTGATASPGGLTIVSSGTYTASSHGAYARIFVTPINTTTLIEAVRVTDAGNVGISTITPQTRLEVNGSFSAGADDKKSTFTITGDLKLASGASLTINGGTLSAGTTGLYIQTVGTMTVTFDANRLIEYRQNTLIGSTATLSMVSTIFSGNAVGGSGFSIIGREARGSSSAPVATAANDTLLALGGIVFDGTNFSTLTKSLIIFQAEENITSTAQGARISFLVTPAGSTTRAEKMTLKGNGRLGVGTTSPVALVEISTGANSTFTDAILVVSSASAATSMMIIRGDGGIGMGKDASSTKRLSVAGDSEFLGNVNVNGTNIVYWCSGSTAGTFDGNLARGNSNAGACAGGTWIATSLRVD